MFEVGLIDAEIIQTIGKSAKNKTRMVTKIWPKRRLRRCSGVDLPSDALARTDVARSRQANPFRLGTACSDIFRDLLPHPHEAILKDSDGGHNEEDHNSDRICISVIRAAARFKGQAKRV